MGNIEQHISDVRNRSVSADHGGAGPQGSRLSSGLVGWRDFAGPLERSGLRSSVGAVPIAAMLLFAVISARDATPATTLVHDGQPQAVIVLREDAGPVLRHAATELVVYLERITGAALEIRNTPAEAMCSITIGTADAAHMPLTADMRRKAATLEDDGYLLASDADGLRVVGHKPLGCLYGVYGLLKKHGDVRWLFPGPDGEYCERKPSFSVEYGIAVSNPSFSSRTLNLVCANINSRMTDTWDWMIRNGMQIPTQKHQRNRLHHRPQLRHLYLIKYQRVNMLLTLNWAPSLIRLSLNTKFP